MNLTLLYFIPVFWGLFCFCYEVQPERNQTSDHLSPSSHDDSRSSTPKSDSELTTQDKNNPEMLWTWGELPQAAQVHTHNYGLWPLIPEQSKSKSIVNVLLRKTINSQSFSDAVMTCWTGLLFSLGACLRKGSAWNVRALNQFEIRICHRDVNKSEETVYCLVSLVWGHFDWDHFFTGLFEG